MYVGRYSFQVTDTSQTLGRHLADTWPIIGRYLTDVSASNLPIHMTYDWYATDSWPICHRQLTDISPTVDWYTADIWPIFGRGASTKYRPILGRHYVDSTYSKHDPDLPLIRVAIALNTSKTEHWEREEGKGRTVGFHWYQSRNWRNYWCWIKWLYLYLHLFRLSTSSAYFTTLGMSPQRPLICKQFIWILAENLFTMNFHFTPVNKLLIF